jgi:hypothetical protein
VINQPIRLRQKDFERLLAQRHIIDDNEVKTLRICTRGGPARRFSDFQQNAAIDCSAGRETTDAAASANDVDQRCVAIKCVFHNFNPLVYRQGRGGTHALQFSLPRRGGNRRRARY